VRNKYTITPPHQEVFPFGISNSAHLTFLAMKQLHQEGRGVLTAPRAYNQLPKTQHAQAYITPSKNASRLGVQRFYATFGSRAITLQKTRQFERILDVGKYRRRNERLSPGSKTA
jgi:hypothetical protein